MPKIRLNEDEEIVKMVKEAVKIPACNKPVLKFGEAYKAKFN